MSAQDLARQRRAAREADCAVATELSRVINVKTSRERLANLA
jgi:hypothetical protein